MSSSISSPFTASTCRNPDALLMPMNAKEIARRDAAMSREIVLKPNQSNFPTVTFKVGQLVDHIHTAIPKYLPATNDRCWLKGSWTNDKEEFPNDVDIGISLADPDFEEQFNTVLSEFLLANAKKTEKDLMANKVYSKGLPISVYFKPLPINNPGTSGLAFLTYKSIDLDLTIFRQPSRWSVGPLDGKWLHCKENLKRHSMGKEFAKTPEQFAQAQLCIDHHLNPLEEPAAIHNVTLRVLLETTRKACLIDHDTHFVISNEIYKGKPIPIFAKQWASHQQDHYKNDTGKVVEFLNLLQIYQNNSFGCSYIAQAWQLVCQEQNIAGMDELCFFIHKNPQTVPHLLKFIQLALIAKGNQVYEFDFNGKDDPIRPFIAVKSGNQTSYLLLPQTQGSPVELGHSYMDSLPKFIHAKNRLGESIGYKNLSFLKGIFSCVGLESTNKESIENFLEDFQTYFKMSPARSLQQKFGSYQTPESITNRIEAYRANLRTFFAPFVPKPKDSLESKEEEAVALTKRQADLKEAQTKEHLLLFEKGVKSLDSALFNEVGTLIKSLISMEVCNSEETYKQAIEILHQLKIKSIEIFSDERIRKELGESYYKGFLDQILPSLFEKILQNPHAGVFGKACDLYMSLSEHNCFGHVQESAIVTALFNSWNVISPKINSDLYLNGCHLICHAFKKQLINEKEIFLSAFGKLVDSTHTAHLRMAYTKLNEVLIHQQSGITNLFKPLIANSILNNSPELYRPMYKALVGLHKRDPASFIQLMESSGIHRGPEIVNGIQSLIRSLKFNGDETLLYDTLLCVLIARPHHTVIKECLGLFNALIAHQATVMSESRVHVSLKTKERMGLVAIELLKLGAIPNVSIRDKWVEFLAEKLIAVPLTQVEAIDGSSYNRYQELGYELLTLLVFSSEDRQWQEKVQQLLPKVTVVKKIEDTTETIIDKVERAVAELTDLVSKGSKTQKVRGVGQRILSTLQQVQQKELEQLSKDFHGMLLNKIDQAQFLLSNTDDLSAVNLAYQIYQAAKVKSLVNSEIEDQNILWIIQGHLNNATSSNEIMWTSKLMPLINGLMKGIGAKSKLLDSGIDTVIEALKRLSRKTVEEKKIVVNHLISLSQCKSINEKTRGLLIEASYGIIQELVKESKVEPFELALELLHTLAKEIPFKEHRQQFKEVVEILGQYLPNAWRGQGAFDQMMDFVEFLRKSEILLQIQERFQFAIITAVHRTHSTEEGYVWELVRFVSKIKSNPYNILLRYIEFACAYRDIHMSLATMLSSNYNDGLGFWTLSIKLMADELLILLYASTNNIANLKKAIKIFCALPFNKKQLEKKIVMSVYDLPLEQVDAEINNYLIKYFPAALYYSINSLSIDEKFLDATCKFIHRLLESGNVEHQKLGTRLTNYLFHEAFTQNLKIDNQNIVQILKLNFQYLLKQEQLFSVHYLILYMQPVLKKEVIADLYADLENGIKKFSNQYLVQIQKANMDTLNTVSSKVIEEFIPFVAKYFPEFGRKFHILFFKQACLVAGNFAMIMPYLTPRIEKYGLFKNMTAGPFTTRAADDKEQFEINNKRLPLEAEDAMALMATIPRHPSALTS